ncbi:hypothetical protein [Acinetobacter sp. P8-3-8]|uniref:hypothetical protein n=1 Tax=Acinetobacter sp. P8-3-8 TaxID=1029823 RepID=UPI0002486CB4|nr:hypothetical protein [Acinetobacter sp. P8-3-8]
MSNQQPTNQQPNKLIAPIVIAGITIGFLASAYKFVFAKPNKQRSKAAQQAQEDHPKDSQD